MSLSGWTSCVAALVALAAPPAALQAGSTQSQWQLAKFTWVKLVPAEKGAPACAHPTTLAPETLAAILGTVTYRDGSQDTPLFLLEEAAALAKPLSQALALARPGEDLILLSTRVRSTGFLDPALGLTARLFVEGGALNLIVHDARLDFTGRFYAEGWLPEFAFGSRTAPSKVALSAPQATRLRADWLALPLAAPAAVPAAMPATVPAAATPAPVPAPAPAKAQPAPARDAAFYQAQHERLKALKQLRDENLISEAEYQQKRDAILKEL